MLYQHKQMEHPDEEIVQEDQWGYKDWEPDELLNSKSEMNHPKIDRIGVQNRN